MLTFVFWAVIAVAAVWLVASMCNYVKTDEVALVRLWGHIVPELHKSGLVFVPLCWGIDLIRIPTKLFHLSYEGDAAHKIYSKDHQLVLPDAVFFVRFPYSEIDSLISMIQAGVPLDEEGLRDWAEDILIPALRQVFSGKNHTDIIGNVDLAAIKREVNTVLHRNGSILRTTCVLGKDYKDTNPGTGQAFAEIEAIFLTEGLQNAMQLPVVAKYEADAAEATKKRDAALIIGPLEEAMDTWVRSQVPADGSKTFAQVKTELVASGKYGEYLLTAQTLILAKGGNLTVSKMEIGGPGGTKLPGGLQYLSIGGGGAGVMVGGRKGGRGPKGGGGGTTVAELDGLADDLNNKPGGKK